MIPCLVWSYFTIADTEWSTLWYSIKNSVGYQSSKTSSRSKPSTKGWGVRGKPDFETSL